MLSHGEENFLSITKQYRDDHDTRLAMLHIY